jgi:hypothetical protein
MSDLKNFIKNNSTYVDWKNVPKHTFNFIEAKVVQNNFDPEGQTVEYKVIEDGVERTFRSQSLGLAQLLVDKEGKTVTVERTGQGAKTTWHLIGEEDAPIVEEE